MLRLLIGSFFAVTFAQAFAASVTVSGVQMPAWVVRNGQQAPLKVGTVLINSDQLRTGSGARILLRLQDGSSVKLGGNATLRLDELNEGKDIFSAALQVIKGAFRFSTDLLMKDNRRNVRVLIGTATIGIRGTDVWGKATEEKDIVCLLEGKITVDRGTDPQVVMQDPLTFYIAPKDQPAQALAPVPLEQLAEWAKETDIQAGQGAARMGGKWKVYLMSTELQSEALQAYDTLSDAGYAVDISPLTRNGVTEYRLRIPNLPSRKESEALAKHLQGQPGVGKTSISMR